MLCSQAEDASPTAELHRTRETGPHFPNVTWLKNRGYVLRSDLDRYKAELQASALGVAPVYPPRLDPDPFIPLKSVSAELGVGRRTIGRRIAESRIVPAGVESAAA
jgi:hypothetical protein